MATAALPRRQPRPANQLAANGPANGPANAGGNLAANGPRAPQNAPKPATDMALRYIGFGDTYFGQQKYADALDRYQKAAKADPGVADAWFRQGFALSAAGRYGEAVKAVAQGMKVSPIWPTCDFLLTDVYGADEAGRKATLEPWPRPSTAVRPTLTQPCCWAFTTTSTASGKRPKRPSSTPPSSATTAWPTPS